MRTATVFVACSALAVAVWLLAVACSSALPPEPPFTITVAANRDAAP